MKDEKEAEEERSYYDILRECCSESTTHGIPYLFKRNHLAVKIFWLVCTLASTGVGCWLVAKSIIDYYEYDTVTHAKVVFETPTLFPTVTICSQNMFTTPEAFQYVNQYSLDNGDIAQGEDILSSSFFSENDFTKYSFGVNLLDSKYSDDFRKQMGLSLDTMLLRCYYNNIGCSTEDFDWFFDPYYGSCYSFNRGKNSSGHVLKDKISTKPGFAFGLQLELFVGNPTDANSLAFVNGIHVLVHNKSDKPSFLVGVNANVGEHTAVAVSRTFSNRMEKPYSDCIQDIASQADKSLYVKTILETNFTYKQADCFNVCLQKYTVQNCSCYATDYPYWNTTNQKPCRTINETDCYTNVLVEFFGGDLNEFCGENCPLECDSITYTTSSSSVIYPSDIFASLLKDNKEIQERFDNRQDVTVDELRANILSLAVYYNSLSYLSFTEIVKIEMVDLVAGIGGTLGLFLGVSFLSAVEIFDLFFLWANEYNRRRIKKRSLKSNSINPASNDQPASRNTTEMTERLERGERADSFGFNRRNSGGYPNSSIVQHGDTDSNEVNEKRAISHDV